MDMLGLIGEMGGLGGLGEFGGLLGGPLGALLDSVAFLNAVGIISLIVILAAFYVLSSFKWQFIGRKAGLQSDWMPFVPFARTVYRLSVVDEQWWKMFFLEGWWFYSWLVYTIINAVSGGEAILFAIVLITIYLACCVAYNVYWRYKFYVAHNIRPHFALAALVPWLGTPISVWDYIIAFGRNYPFTGEGTSRALMDVVDVPHAKDAAGNPVALTQALSPSDRGAPWAGSAPGAARSPGAAHSPRPAMAPGMGGGSVTGLSGMYAGQSIPLAAGDEMVVGRDNSLCNLIVDQSADKVSRKHCGITFDAASSSYLVTDYSTNGTFIDGGNRLVANMPTSLQRGTVIALGNRENRFKLN